jgi:putative heme iron utilization protein
MTVEKAPSAHNPKGTGPKGTGPKATEQAQAGRRLMRTAVKGALGTIDHETGHPYASLVLVATEPDGTPVLLLSTLARHTKNLGKDPRASLLLDGTGDRGELLTGDRLTLIGEARPGSSPTALRRFISRHPSAGDYAGFGDFSVYTLRVSGGQECINVGNRCGDCAVVGLAPRLHNLTGTMHRGEHCGRVDDHHNDTAQIRARVRSTSVG